jgi:multidrug efflux pump subunit AcrA (membrane-fusion protein)
MKRRRHWVGSVVLPVIVLLMGVGLAAWKYDAIQAGQAASASQPEPMETVTVALAKEIEHRQTTTSIGTVLALKSITLRNELAGTVREVRLSPGQIVEPGMVLVALDVSVEEAELKAQEAQAALAKTVLDRRQNLNHEMATTQEEVDRARADLDIARAQIARTKAIIARKTIRAPFRSRVGIADVHPGQYLNEGTLLTTLQGIDDARMWTLRLHSRLPLAYGRVKSLRCLRVPPHPSPRRSSRWTRALTRRHAMPWSERASKVPATRRPPGPLFASVFRWGPRARPLPFRSVHCARAPKGIRCS